MASVQPIASPSSRALSQRFYFYDSTRRAFIEIRDGDVVGRKEISRPELRALGDPTDRMLSKRHCTFTVRGSTLYLEDLGSKNPARVNSVPVRPKIARRLHIGDVVDIGSRRFILTAQANHSPGAASEFTSVMGASPSLAPEPGEATVSLTSRVKNRRAIDRKLNRPAWYSVLPWAGVLALMSFILLSWVSSS